MKTTRLLIPLLLITFAAIAQKKPAVQAKKSTAKSTAATATKTASITVAGLPSDEFFSLFVLPHSNEAGPDDYGLSPANPVLVGAYDGDLSDQKRITQTLNRFLKTYIFADGSIPVFVDRQTRMIDNVNYDIFRVTKKGTTDTISLYTDQYKKGTVYPIKGFRFYSKESLVAELTPLAQLIASYDALPDKYNSTTGKAAGIRIVSTIQRDLGLDELMDADYIGPIVNDSGMDLDLKAFLVRSYIFHRLANEVTGQPNPKVKAYNTMLDDYQLAIKSKNIFAKGILPTLTKK